jgi:hypothetical protein
MKSLSDFEEMNGAPSEEDHAISLFVLRLKQRALLVCQLLAGVFGLIVKSQIMVQLSPECRVPFRR